MLRPAGEDEEDSACQAAADNDMEQLVLCLAQSTVQVVKGDGAAIETILKTLQPSTERVLRSAQLHLLANAFKQACLLVVFSCSAQKSMSHHLYTHMDTFRHCGAPSYGVAEDNYCAGAAQPVLSVASHGLYS